MSSNSYAFQFEHLKIFDLVDTFFHKDLVVVYLPKSSTPFGPDGPYVGKRSQNYYCVSLNQLRKNGRCKIVLSYGSCIESHKGSFSLEGALTGNKALSDLALFQLGLSPKPKFVLGQYY